MQLLTEHARDDMVLMFHQCVALYRYALIMHYVCHYAYIGLGLYVLRILNARMQSFANTTRREHAWSQESTRAQRSELSGKEIYGATRGTGAQRMV
jgi:hypothetical protein